MKNKGGNRRKKYTVITTEINNNIMEMYGYRIALVREAEQFTIEMIAKKLNIGINTVWSRVNGMMAERIEMPSYVETLEGKVHLLNNNVTDLQCKLEHIKRRLREISFYCDN